MNRKIHRPIWSTLAKALYLVAAMAGTGVTNAATTTLFEEDFEGRANASTYVGSATVQSGSGFDGSKGVVAEYNIVRGTDGNGSNRMVRNIQFTNTTFDSATLSYRIKFDSDFTTTLGGKYMGMGPTNFITGGRNVDPNGWSTRVVMDDRVPYVYVYDQDKDLPFGRKVEPFDPTPLTFSQWHDVSLFVQLNSIGTSNDGLVQLYIDDVLRSEFSDARLRGVTSIDTLPNTLLFHTFLGGTDDGDPLSTQHVYFDDFRIESGFAVAVPEPSSMVLLFVARTVLSLKRRRRRR